VIETNGAHSEWFWKLEFPDAYRWLFDIEASISIHEPAQDEILLYYDILTASLYIERTDIENLNYSLFDINGRLLEANQMQSDYLNFSNLRPGIYFVTLTRDGFAITQKIIILNDE
jgi:hypothetical protein